MPLAHVKFFAEPREFTDEQIKELRAARLLREDENKPGPQGTPAAPPVASQPGTAPAVPPAAAGAPPVPKEK